MHLYTRQIETPNLRDIRNSSLEFILGLCVPASELSDCSKLLFKYASESLGQSEWLIKHRPAMLCYAVICANAMCISKPLYGRGNTYQRAETVLREEKYKIPALDVTITHLRGIANTSAYHQWCHQQPTTTQQAMMCMPDNDLCDPQPRDPALVRRHSSDA